MSVAPLFSPLNRTSLTPLTDFTPARASLIPRTQHALMSGWGGPPQGRTIYIAAENGVALTRYIGVEAPPGVLEVDMEVLACGRGTIAFTTADDTGTGFRIQRDSYGPTSAPALDYARWSRTGGGGEPTDDAGRALIVRSSVVWTHESIATTVVVTPDVDRYLTVFAIIFHPIHVPR